MDEIKISIREQIAAFLFRHQMRGAVRFYRFALKQARIGIRTKHGVVLRLNPYEYVDNKIIRNGYYEEEVLLALLRVLRPADVFWDIGANVGLHALTVAKLLPNVFVQAFEPNPQLADLIRKAARLNSLAVQVVEVALDCDTGTAPLFLHEGNLGQSSLHNWDSNPLIKHIDVTTSRAADQVARHGVRAPNAIKLDVEGNEARVLRGMGNLLSDKTLRAVVFEDAMSSTSEVKQIMADAGFHIVELARLEDTHHGLENFLAQR